MLHYCLLHVTCPQQKSFLDLLFILPNMGAPNVQHTFCSVLVLPYTVQNLNGKSGFYDMHQTIVNHPASTYNVMSEMKLHISEGGVRYCPFLQLSYFNLIKYHIIVPMHNLLLGTTKHVLETWLDKQVLNKRGRKQLRI